MRWNALVIDTLGRGVPFVEASSGLSRRLCAGRAYSSNHVFFFVSKSFGLESWQSESGFQRGTIIGSREDDSLLIRLEIIG